jgi:hypothetical protein
MDLIVQKAKDFELAEKISKFIQSQPKRRLQAVTFAVTCTVIYSWIRSKLSPPKNLRHIPHWSYLDFFKLMSYNRDEIEPRTRALTKSLIEKSGDNSKGLCMVSVFCITSSLCKYVYLY